MKLQFHQEAVREYDKAILWYMKRSLTAPFKFEAEVDEATERILAAPQIFPVVLPRRRKALLKKIPIPPDIRVDSGSHQYPRNCPWQAQDGLLAETPDGILIHSRLLLK